MVSVAFGPGGVIIDFAMTTAVDDRVRWPNRTSNLTPALEWPAMERRLAMRGPQSASPDFVPPTRSKRRFTVSQANQTLPLIRRIAADIVESHANAVAVQSHLAEARKSEVQPLRAQLGQLVERLEDLVDELREVGCELKDYAVGLIDFTGTHEGHDVCLCWKLGEESVAHWHEQDAGFSGRQPIEALRETAHV